MLVYYYDEETKEFLYSEEAPLDPLETELKGENVYLLPANATFDEPLEPKEGYKVVFDGSWKYEPIPEPEPEYVPSEEELSQQKIYELKTKLADTDYVAIKIAEGSATASEYADVIAQRKAWRAEINELEKSK